MISMPCILYAHLWAVEICAISLLVGEKQWIKRIKKRKKTLHSRCKLLKREIKQSQRRKVVKAHSERRHIVRSLHPLTLVDVPLNFKEIAHKIFRFGIFTYPPILENGISVVFWYIILDAIGLHTHTHTHTLISKEKIPIAKHGGKCCKLSDMDKKTGTYPIILPLHIKHPIKRPVTDARRYRILLRHIHFLDDG